MNPLEKIIADSFHVMFYFSDHTWNRGYTKWMGVPVLQSPFDMWTFQEVIVDTLPEVIIETGSAAGGSALFFASIFDLLAKIKKNVDGSVISIDTQAEMETKVSHPRIKFIKGKSVDPKIVNMIKSKIKRKRVMVVLDSDHTDKNVSAEIKIYAPFVTPGCYLVVCDTNLGGHPVFNNAVPGLGPMKAVEKFFKSSPDFDIDKFREEKYFMTFFPNGWLRRKA